MKTLPWREHLKMTEKKIVKNIGLINKVKPFLNKDSLLALYFLTFTLTLTMLT